MIFKWDSDIKCQANVKSATDSDSEDNMYINKSAVGSDARHAALCYVKIK